MTHHQVQLIPGRHLCVSGTVEFLVHHGLVLWVQGASQLESSGVLLLVLPLEPEPDTNHSD